MRIYLKIKFELNTNKFELILLALFSLCLSISCNESRLDESCYIPAVDIIYNVEQHLNQIDKKFDYYNYQFSQIFQITQWYSENIKPIADDLIDPVQTILYTSSMLPLPFVDKISSIARRGITLIVNTSDLITGFSTELDKFQEINKKIKALHLQYEETEDKKYLFSIKNVLDNKYRNNLAAIHISINKVDTLLGYSLSILEFIKKAKFHSKSSFESLDETISELTKYIQDLWSSESEAKSRKIDKGILSQDSIDRIIEKMNIKIREVQTISEELSKHLEEDLYSISIVIASIQILEMCANH